MNPTRATTLPASTRNRRGCCSSIVRNVPRVNSEATVATSTAVRNAAMKPAVWANSAVPPPGSSSVAMLRA